MKSRAAETLRIRREPPVLRVGLNRPDVRNAFNEEMIVELTDLFASLGSEDAGTRVVVLQGEGPVFCAGADLAWMRRASGFTEEENRADALRMASMFRAIAEVNVPVVAAVHGAALGGGSGLVAAVDIAVAAEDAVFGFTEARLGIIPAVISPFVLRKVHAGDVRRYFLTGERFGASEALRIGLVQAVGPAGDPAPAVEEVCSQLLAAGPRAQSEVKDLLRRVPREPAESVHELTAGWIARLRVSPEAREGFAAFLERRKPSWHPEAPGDGAR